jgi:hypothetical protein
MSSSKSGIKLAVVLLPGGSPKPEISRGWEPREQRCLGEGTSNKNSSDAGSSNSSSNLKQRANDAKIVHDRAETGVTREV